MIWNKSLVFVVALVLSSSASLINPIFNQVNLLSSTNSEPIEDRYIVVFKDGISHDASAFTSHFSWLTNYISLLNYEGGEEYNSITHIYDNSIVGYAGRFQKKVLDELLKSDDIAFIEKDAMVYASMTEKNAPWGLARISHRDPLSFGTYDKYIYNETAGSGVTVYVVDTGIHTGHDEFGTRAIWGTSTVQDNLDTDGNGHGTHVAGTIGGEKYGVAKKAKIVAVKVLDANGSGSTSGVIKGIDYTLKSHRAEKQQALAENKKFKGSVANMSLGGGYSRALNLAVDTAVKGGVFYTVAAGNENQDSCQTSPASAERVLTVGATDIADRRAWFSNYGKCTDVFAPGKDILSAWIGSKKATNSISGTSMATPHVAGLAAYLLSLSEKNLTPSQLKKLIINLSTADQLEDVPVDTPNLLVFNNPPENFNFVF